MRNIGKIKKILFFLAPAILYLLLFGRYFFSDTYLFGFAEWYSPYSPEHLKDYFFRSLFLYSDNNWGTPQYYPQISIYNGLRIILGFVFGFTLSQKVLVFSLFYLSFLSCFLFIKRVTRETKFAYLAALLFSLNPYALNHFVFGHLVLNMSFIWLLFSGYFLLGFYETKKKWNLFVAILFFAVNPMHPLYVPFYLFFYFLIGLYKEISFRKNLAYILAVLFFFLLLNASWVINLMVGSDSVNEVLDYKSSSLGRITSQSKPIINSFFNSEYFNKNRFLNNNESAQLSFDLSMIFLWSAFITLIAFVKRVKNKTFYLITFASILLLMHLLAGPFTPFGQDIFNLALKSRLYQLYREVYHLTFPLILASFFLAACLYKNIKKESIIAKLAIALLLVSLTLRIISVSEYGKLSTLSVKVYGWNSEQLAENKKDYDYICKNFRTSQYVLFVPFYHTIYDTRTNSQDKEGGADLFVARNCVGTIGNWVTLTPPFKKMLDVFKVNSDNAGLFSDSGIKYVVFRKDFISGSEKKYSSQAVLERIESDKNFVFVAENDNFKIYENGYNNGLIQSPNLSFQKINPVKYKISIRNVQKQSLSFLQIFSKNWKLYLRPKSFSGWCDSPVLRQGSKSRECGYRQKYFEGEELSYLWKNALFDETHVETNGYTNQWSIDPGYIKRNYSSEYYRENPDGSVDIEMVLYFRPQSYYYLGLLVSGATFLGMIGYLIHDQRKRKRLKPQKDAGYI